MTDSQNDYDSPWKQILEDYFQEFIAFFFPHIHTQIDWTQPHIFLDKELQQVVRDAEFGKRLADKLVKLWRLDGEEFWVLLHVEIQAQEETQFGQRMYVYHYRLFDKYRQRVASLAVLGDERANWRPDHYGYDLFGCEMRFRFPIVKLTDYQTQWTQLEANPNPFSTVVMAHLKTLETSDNREVRKIWKVWLVKRLYAQGYSQQDVLNLLHFIDWIMTLPEELENEFWQEIIQFEEEQKMAYITGIERRALAKGEQQGRRDGLLAGIQLGLKLKFGAAGLALLPEIEALQDVEMLQAILNALEVIDSLEALRLVYQ